MVRLASPDLPHVVAVIIFGCMDHPNNRYEEPSNPYEEISLPFEETAKAFRDPRQSKTKLALKCVRVVFWVGVVLVVLFVSLKARDIRQNIYYALFNTTLQKKFTFSQPQPIAPNAWRQQAEERARIRGAKPKKAQPNSIRTPKKLLKPLETTPRFEYPSGKPRIWNPPNPTPANRLPFSQPLNPQPKKPTNIP